MKVQVFIKIGDSLIEKEGDIIFAISEAAAKSVADQHLAKGLISVPEHVALQYDGYFQHQFGGRTENGVTGEREQGLCAIIEGDFTDEEISQLAGPVEGKQMYRATGTPVILAQHRFRVDLAACGISGDTLENLRDGEVTVEPRHDKPIPKSKLIDKKLKEL